MRFIYTLALYLLVPAVLVRLLWRSRRAPDYRRRWGERFALYRAREPEPFLWVHAVSVGEVQAAVPLVEALLARQPSHPVVVTTTTPTGSQRVRELFGDRVAHVYVPYDLPGAVRRFLNRYRPRIAVIMETELWPNLFHGCSARRIPVVVANARLSARSARGYARVRSLIRDTLAQVTVIAAQGQADADRFLDLGADRARLRITGSIKFDLKLPASLREQAEVLRLQLGNARPVWVAGSTHEGEEGQVLDAFAQVRKSVPDCLLVLVPRHPERFAGAGALCRRRGFKVASRAAQEQVEADTDVYLGDTLGELTLLYGAADVAFVGGSMVPVGGHNLLEPAALGVAVVIGPHTFNFEEITRMLEEVGGVRKVHDSDELAGCLEALLRDANLRHNVGERARAFVDANRGALERLLNIISVWMR
ncbi:MAG: lipid IV(A) 3-deoxy-D-manno-octulosonic acid transferase [Gammaproteobacteria bacterium]